MKPNASGNYCDACQKTVIDFTVMTDTQVLEYLKQDRGNSCGRFYTDQLAQPLALPVKRTPWLRYILTVALPAMLLSYKSQAQRVIGTKSQRVEVPGNISHAGVNTRSGLTITGTVTGENGEPVPFASVVVAGSNRGAAADSSGQFSLKLTSLDKRLQVSAVGYQQQDVAISGPGLQVQLQLTKVEDVIISSNILTRRCPVTMGGYSTVVSSRKETSNTSATSKAVETLEVYPNPARRTGQVTLRFKKPVSDNQQVTIYNAGGEMLQQQVIPVSFPLSIYTFNLRLPAAGVYFLTMTDEKERKKQSVQFVVE